MHGADRGLDREVLLPVVDGTTHASTVPEHTRVRVGGAGDFPRAYVLGPALADLSDTLNRQMTWHTASSLLPSGSVTNAA
jgi:hypothetical protein